MISKITSLQDYYHQYEQSIANPEAFWAKQGETFEWFKRWDSVLEWNFSEPSIKWFSGGKLNITQNCLDRHLAAKSEQTALIWEPNHPDEKGRSFTYQQLHTEVCKFSNVLLNLRVQPGDRVCLYMPMVPELAIAVLACARIGAVHSVVFAGFSAQALADRINDAGARLVITSDGSYRGEKEIAVKALVDEALAQTPQVNNVIVYQRTGADVHMTLGRDHWWHLLMASASPKQQPVATNSEDLLFILYTSGSTGKPKGVVHTVAGYMVFAEYTFTNVFQYSQGQVYWCTADIGWITGHTYLLYGPLLAGATTLMFEGIPTYPDAGRFWRIIDNYKVNIFYTAPTVIRSLEALGTAPVEKYKLESLQVLGTVGEPINEEAWHWYDTNIGKRKCPIVDTWWQTETGGILISPLAGITPAIPSFATLPLPGIQPVIVDNDGKVLEGNGVEGNLCIKFPWPGMIRTTYLDHARCKQTYFSAYHNLYFTGDGCKRDANGNYRILGRVDDVMNISGHRIGTAEVENAINEHLEVVESAVVAFPHPIKGSGIYAFVVCPHVPENLAQAKTEIMALVTKQIGPIAKPDKIQFVKGLPKTRSGKIMRRILRKVAEGEVGNLGDVSTLLDPGLVQEIISGALT